MKYLIATIAALFLAAVWATPAKAQNCGGQFQLIQSPGFVPVQSFGFAFAPTNNVFVQRSFVPVQSFGFAAVPTANQIVVNRGFNQVVVNRGFAPQRTFIRTGLFGTTVIQR